MIERMDNAGAERSGPLIPREQAGKPLEPLRPQGAGGADDAPGGEPVGLELNELIARIKAADAFRRERVHQVLEKMANGQLVTSEAVRGAAERLLAGGP